MATSSPQSPASIMSDTAVLTPGRKVKALLAQFGDSDSEDENGQTAAAVELPATSNSDVALEQPSSGSEEDVPVTRKSRMAARLEATTKPLSVASETKEALVPTSNSTAPSSDQDDEVVEAPIRRRLLTKRKSSPMARSSPPQTESAQPPSPMFFPSPSRSQRSRGQTPNIEASEDEEQVEEESTEEKSKFMALVEKARKLRAEKEVAEEAKRAARRVAIEAPPSSHKRQRGSSPGDDSHESSQGSDAEAARKIAKRAKPTRKASKKAVEEMKRETQRLSRNTQLAHQAKTKKKFSVQDFVAKFNSRGKTTAQNAAEGPNNVNASSSPTASDSERSRHHMTPPTSPMQEPQKELVAQGTGHGDDLELVQEPPSLAEIGLEAVQDNDKGKGKVDTAPLVPSREDFVVATANVPAATAPTSTTLSSKAAKRQRLSELLRKTRASSADEVEDDLDIVTARGDLRKIAAFENLPKHKAKETASHLALRTLANLNSKERDKKSTMTAAEMQASLRRAAGLQARAERQQKLDELRARGVVIQTAEERERDQQEVEDLVEKARQEAAEISKREKERAKKDGTFVKDALDDDDDSEDDEDFIESEQEPAESEDEESEDEGHDPEDDVNLANEDGNLFDDQADDADSEEGAEAESEPEAEDTELEVDAMPNIEAPLPVATPAARKSRTKRVLSDDEDETPVIETPKLPQVSKTPQTVLRSNRRQIPGLHMSDDLPLGLTQAFAATMADSQTQQESAEEQDSMDYVGDLPSPGLALMPRLNRLESLDLVTDSQPATQTQPLNINLEFSLSQRVLESPSVSHQLHATQATPSQAPFEPTQDGGYLYSPFHGNRFMAETPNTELHSTIETVPLHEAQASPIVMRKGRLTRGRMAPDDADEPSEDTAFEIMKRAAKKANKEDFDKTKSNAKDVVDEAAEESDDEYAGLGGASDDDGNDIENEEDRKLIDDDTQVGKGDEAALAGFYADRERKSDEAALTKLYQDINTGRLRHRRGGGELDLSDEEDAAARRREAKRRDFAKMRRELLKDEAVGKIAEDKKKEAFLRSIEDHQQVSDDDDDDLDASETQDSQSQTQGPQQESIQPTSGEKRKRPLDPASESQLNRLPPALRRSAVDKKPSTLAEIQESLSFCIQGDSQIGDATLGLSDSEDEPEKYVNLDRHFAEAEADENADEDDAQGLGDFIVDDDDEDDDDSTEEPIFKKPSLPTTSLQTSSSHLEAATPSSRRSRGTVINRLSTLQRASSSSASTKMAFVSTSSATQQAGSSFKVPSLLRRATTNSSLSSLNSSSTESRSATGVTIAKTERKHVSEEKVFVRKGMGGRRNAVNYQAGERPKQAQQLQQVGGRNRKGGAAARAKGGFLGDLLGRSNTWD